MPASRSPGRVLALVAAALATALAGSCTDTAPPVGLAEGCSINSDCEGALVCAFGRCHVACESSKDCDGASCVPPGVCELKAEETCSETLPCVTGLTCVGAKCLAPCDIDGGALGQSQCLPDQTCTEADGQGVCEDIPSDAGGAGGRDAGPKDAGSRDGTLPTDAPSESGKDATLHDGSSRDGSSGDGSSRDGGDGGASGCVGVPETVFSPAVQGKSNPSFTSGVGVRTATQALLFSGYSGPQPSGFDAGPDGGSAGLVYVQAFDVGTRQSLGDPAPLVEVPGSSSVRVLDAAVAPSGEIALLVGAEPSTAFAYGSPSPVPSLYAVFLATSDGGAAPTVEQLQEVESDTVYGQPSAIWVPSSGTFVFSWLYDTNSYMAVQKFLPGGISAGGGADPVPTVYGADQGANANYLQGAVGASAAFLGVAYRGTSWTAHLTMLDVEGNLVPSPVEGVGFDIGSAVNNWVAVGGTGSGFVYVSQVTGGPLVAFVPTALDAGYLGDGGGSPGALASFTATGPTAIVGRAVSDGPGGGGGVGVETLYTDSLRFMYVGPTGALVTGPGEAIAHSYVAGDETNISSFGGSFTLALYSLATHSTEMVISTCVP